MPKKIKQNEDQVGEEMVEQKTDPRLGLAKKIIVNIREQLGALESLMDEGTEMSELSELVRTTTTQAGELMAPMNEGRVIEGVFDGEHMVGSDGKQYVIPPNYASKSKLVEGDMLKLTIRPDGSFIYKQIGPIERERIMGALIRDEHTGDFCVVADGKKYHVLQASVSYYKGEEDDGAVILVPRSTPSKWAAIENIVSKE